MVEYIEREWLKEQLKIHPAHEYEYPDFVEMVNKAPTADVVEVRHGYWQQNKYCERIYYCSECGRHIEDGSIHKNPSVHFPYCHCGAKMDGKGEGE